MGNKARTLVKLTIASSCMLGDIIFRPLLLGVSIQWGELLSALVGIASNNAASAIDTLIEGDVSDRIALPSDDLTKTVGRAIAAVIALAATQHPGKVGSYLEKIAAQAAQNWLQIARQDLTKQRYPTLQAGQVEAFLTPEEMYYAKEGNLIPSDWEDIFRRLNMAADGSGGFPLPSEVYKQVAGLLHAHFPQALEAALKDDFATDGKAFAGVTLQLLLGLKTQLARWHPSQTSDQTTGWPESLAVLKRLEAQLQGSAAQQQVAFSRIAEHIDSGFAAVCAQMGVMESTITDLIQPLEGNLERLRQDVAEVRQDIHQGFEEVKTHQRGRSLSRQEGRSRQKLLADLRTEVESRLSKSLHNAVLLNLGKEVQPHQVQRPYDVSVKLGQQQLFQLPSETSILDVFDHETIGGRFLILGKPGSGKSTTLLELAKALLERAEVDSDAPIPVLLELSTWQKVTKRKLLIFGTSEEYNPSIKEWIVTQLNRKGISPKLSEQWLLEKELILLLDGLDELPSDFQGKCVKATNQLILGEFCPLNIVVCSRKEEYENYKETLSLNGAITLQDLSRDQIKKCITQANLEELWLSIKESERIIELIKQPLFLKITIAAYHQIDLQEWKNCNSEKNAIDYLLGTYRIQAIQVNYRSLVRAAAKEDEIRASQHSLSWLAKCVQKGKRVDISLEELQSFSQAPETLKLDKNISFAMFLVYLFFMLLIFRNVLTGMLFLLLEAIKLASWETPFATFLIITTAFGYFIPIAAVLIILMVMAALVNFILFQIGQKSWNSPIFAIAPSQWISYENLLLIKQIIVKSGVETFAKVSIFPLVFIVITWYLSFQYDTVYIPLFKLVFMLVIWALYYTFLFLPISVTCLLDQNRIIQPKEIYNRGINYSQLILVVAIKIVSLVIYYKLVLFPVSVMDKLPRSLQIPPALFFPPLMSMDIPFIFFEWLFPILFAVYVGVFFGGGYKLLRYLMIRIILSRNGYIPWNISRFLDDFTKCLVLQRVGNRYRFIHRLVQEHFANLEIPENHSKSSR